ncbi:MAG: hypothetical protein AB7V04_10175 [Desulfomonilaceae bacterium]
MQRCKTCGREYTVVQTMTYSSYGYCSWECLMNKKTKGPSQNRSNRKSGQRNSYNSRTKWASS